MALPVSFRWDEGFVGRVDAARGDVPRSVFVRRAVERALGDSGLASDSGSAAARRPDPAPAEQPERWEGFPVQVDERVAPGRVEAIVPPAREFRPYPKGGKR